jgi:LruC domain-containing protein
VTPSKTVTVLLELSTPVTLDSSAAPFDIFLYRSDDPSHEIHRPMYGGTANMNTSLFGTLSDGSTSSRHFVTSNGIPFALDVPPSTRYPLEAHGISLLYPDILGFGSSGGAQNTNYYATNIQSAHAFTGDVFGVTPPAPVIPARVEVYDNSCKRTIQ